MGLYERWTTSDNSKIPVHTFGAAMRELARGAVTKTQVVSAFSLDSTDESELDLIIAKYTAMTSTEKAAFVVKLHDVMLLCEGDFYNKTKAKTELGF